MHRFGIYHSTTRETIPVSNNRRRTFSSPRPVLNALPIHTLLQSAFHVPKLLRVKAKLLVTNHLSTGLGKKGENRITTAHVGTNELSMLSLSIPASLGQSGTFGAIDISRPQAKRGVNHNVNDTHGSDNAIPSNPSRVTTSLPFAVDTVHADTHALTTISGSQLTMPATSNPSGGTAQLFAITRATRYFQTEYAKDNRDSSTNPSTHGSSTLLIELTMPVRPLRRGLLRVSTKTITAALSLALMRVDTRLLLAVSGAPVSLDVPFASPPPSRITMHERETTRFTKRARVAIDPS